MLLPPARKERDPDPPFDLQREHKRIRIEAPVFTADLYDQYISTDRLHDEEAGTDEAISYWLSRYDCEGTLVPMRLVPIVWPSHLIGSTLTTIECHPPLSSWPHAFTTTPKEISLASL